MKFPELEYSWVVDTQKQTTQTNEKTPNKQETAKPNQNKKNPTNKKNHLLTRETTLNRNYSIMWTPEDQEIKKPVLYVG